MVTEAQIFTWPVRVYVEDTDFGGVVFYANYLKYFERVRSEFLRSLGVTQQSLVEAHRLMFVVNHISVDYRSPARMDDDLLVTVQPKKVGRASITFLQEVKRGAQLLVSAEVGIACVNMDTMRPHPIPEFMRTKMQAQTG
ncbi:MAG: tol-pal system-associated acyl-CoA thioesterase [Oxalobacter sp.]|nr:MAG: tol-pal system-associated acyl-CoA thioesterase [Oxalobacter sp.]